MVDVDGLYNPCGVLRLSGGGSMPGRERRATFHRSRRELLDLREGWTREREREGSLAAVLICVSSACTAVKLLVV